MSLLSVNQLYVTLKTSYGQIHAVRGVDFQIEEGETVALVGESGCGKSTTCLSVTNLLPRQGKHRPIHKGNEIIFEGQPIQDYSEKQMRSIRGKKVGMIFQDPIKSLNPTMKVGEYITEMLTTHKKYSKKQAWTEAINLLDKVGVSDSANRMHQYPHELSGGMRQRIMIASAIACNPRLLIADEPTTALDVTTQAQILQLLKQLQQQEKMAILLVTHNLGIVASIAHRILIMYGGKIVESGTTEDVFYNPKHPYTKALLATVQQIHKMQSADDKLNAIPGMPPNLLNPPMGCPFFPRCSHRMHICVEEHPPSFEISQRDNNAHLCNCYLYHPEYLHQA